MPTVRASADVAAPARDVFGFVVRADNYGRFIPAYDAGAILSGVDGQPGMKLRWRTRVAGLAVSADEELVERVEGERVRYRGSMAGVSFESCMETRPTPSGTRFEVSIRYRLRAPAVGTLLAAALRPAIQREADRTVARVRSIFQSPLPAAAGPSAQGREGLDVVRRVYAAWGRHPALYAAQDWVTFLGRHRALRRRAVQAMGVVRGARVLEVACGTGRNFEYVEEAIGPAGTLVGFDYSAEMLRAAGGLVRRRGWSNVELVQGDAADLEVAGPFDGIVSVLGISAVPDHLRALERCRDLLRPGGILAVCDARRLRGRWARLDPPVQAVYGRWAAWNGDRDLVGDVRRIFGEVQEESHLGGVYFVATARKRASSTG